MRLLAPVRLSRDADSSTSPASQRASITEYAEDGGHEIIWTDVEDLGVSGAVPIRERPGLGPWLEPARLGRWDAICGHEMDRISRDMLDYLLFARDMTKLGKVVIDVSDGTDTSTSRGRQILEDRILAAQRERERVSERRKKAAKRISNAGRWGGGRYPFGYVPACACHGERRCPEPEHTTGWCLVLHEINATIVRTMVADAISGKSMLGIAAGLNAASIQSPVGRPWRDTSIRRILTSPTLVGHVTQMKGSVVTTRRDKDGQPISFTDQPLISSDDWHLLQAALRSRSRHRGLAQSRQQLYRVAFCAACSPYDAEASPRDGDALLYGHTRVKDPAKPGYYTCKRCGYSVRLDLIEGLVESLVIDGCGLYPLTEKKVVPGDDHAAEIARLEGQAERRRELLAEDPDDDALASSLIRLEGKIEVLRMMHEPDMIRRVPIAGGRTIAQHWETLDRHERGQWLRQWGAVAYASKRTLTVRIPEDPANPSPGPLTVVADWN